MPRLILPIYRLVRKDPADAAARVRHVAIISGNYVDMQMENGLACRQPVVDTDIETIGRKLF
jgi:hypothetical protein